MLTTLKAACARPGPVMTRRDGVIGAAVMILSSLIFVALGTYLKRQGWAAASEVVLSLSFSASLLLAMPFLWLKGQPWKAQAFFVGVPMIILVAIAGKLGGSMLMSRWTGMSWSQSFAIGALMNTRGLVELVVLNIGYDLGILSGRIFAMMVLMALVTTFMTGPLLSLVKTEHRARQVAEAV